MTGIIVLLKSKNYQDKILNSDHCAPHVFENVLENESWYLIPDLPESTAEKLVVPMLPTLFKKQNKNGSWKKKNSEKISFDILRALQHVGILDDLILNNEFHYDPKQWTLGQLSEYCLLTKRLIFNTNEPDDDKAVCLLVENIKAEQQTNGSWDNSIVSTCYHMNKMLDFGVNVQCEAIKKGVDYILSTYNEKIDAWHIQTPYGLSINNFFSTENRINELEYASKLYPEWEPRSVCFRHIAIQQNAGELKLLLRLGYENNELVEKSIHEIFYLLTTYNGLCDSDIKKSYLTSAKRIRQPVLSLRFTLLHKTFWRFDTYACKIC